MGKGIVVTGAGSGIGRAVALRFSKDNARLFLLDVNGKGLEETAKLCREEGGTAEWKVVDVSCEAEVESALKEAAGSLGMLDAICHCAAIMGGFSAVEDTATEDFLRILNVNVAGTFFILKHGLAIMKPKQHGVIVCTASSNALVPCWGMSAYTASKNAVVGLIRSAAFENGRTGVRVCGVIPGNTNTPMIAQCIDAARESSGPMGRVAEPKEVAASYAYLVSDEATYTNGTVLVTNGGMAMA